jgi:hypothetical protein
MPRDTHALTLVEWAIDRAWAPLTPAIPVEKSAKDGNVNAHADCWPTAEEHRHRHATCINGPWVTELGGAGVEDAVRGYVNATYPLRVSLERINELHCQYGDRWWDAFSGQVGQADASGYLLILLNQWASAADSLLPQLAAYRELMDHFGNARASLYEVEREAAQKADATPSEEG